MSCTRCVGEHVQLVDIVVRSKALGDLVGGIGSQWELVKEALDRSGDGKERTGIGLLWRAIGPFRWHCGGFEAVQSSKVSKCRHRNNSDAPSPKRKVLPYLIMARYRPPRTFFFPLFRLDLGISLNLRSMDSPDHMDSIS